MSDICERLAETIGKLSQEGQRSLLDMALLFGKLPPHDQCLMGEIARSLMTHERSMRVTGLRAVMHGQPVITDNGLVFTSPHVKRTTSV